MALCKQAVRIGDIIKAFLCPSRRWWVCSRSHRKPSMVPGSMPTTLVETFLGFALAVFFRHLDCDCIVY